MPSKLNDPTREITIVNVDDHPIFNRLWGKEGFVRVNEENLEAFKSAKGLVLIFFALERRGLERLRKSFAP